MYVNRDGCHMWEKKCAIFPEHLISLPLESSWFHQFVIYTQQNLSVLGLCLQINDWISLTALLRTYVMLCIIQWLIQFTNLVEKYSKYMYLVYFVGYNPRWQTYHVSWIWARSGPLLSISMQDFQRTLVKPELHHYIATIHNNISISYKPLAVSTNWKTSGYLSTNRLMTSHWSRLTRTASVYWVPHDT